MNASHLSVYNPGRYGFTNLTSIYAKQTNNSFTKTTATPYGMEISTLGILELITNTLIADIEIKGSNMLAWYWFVLIYLFKALSRNIKLIIC